jgi:hypothetical protein
MKKKMPKKIQKLALTSVFDIITKTYKQTPATANQIIASVNAWAADRGLTAIVPVIYAMIEQESGFNPNASGGLLQLTAPAKTQLEECYGYNRGYDGIDPNINAGIYYLHICLCGNGGNIAKAVKAYNGSTSAGDVNYLQHVSAKLPNYTTNTGLINLTMDVEGCLRKWLEAANIDSVVVSPSSVNKGEKALVTWAGKNPYSVDIFQIKVRIRLVGLAAEPVDQVISRTPANSTVTRSVQLTIGAQTKSGDHTIMATAQTASTKCGGARKSLKTVLTVKEQKKTVLLERKDGIQEHYHVCDNDPKYAGEFGIPTETTWA